jgi:hypothetical protein
MWDLLAHATKHGWSLVALEQKRLHGLLDAPESAILAVARSHELDLSCASFEVAFGLCDRPAAQTLGTILTRASCTALRRAASC